MKKVIFCVLVCMLLLLTVLPVSATRNQSPITLNATAIGISTDYKSMIDISSPDGNVHHCIMFCKNHEQVLDWISSINEFGFQKAWLKKFLELTIVFMLPGTVFLFGLSHFRNAYAELSIHLKYKDEFLNFLNSYDIENASGMITYLWLSGNINRPVDFKTQPDNTWIEDSWILDDGAYIPNPEIWFEAFFWHF